MVNVGANAAVPAPQEKSMPRALFARTAATIPALVMGAALSAAPFGAQFAALAQDDADAGAPTEIEALRAETEALRGMLPGQAHTMMDVDYNFANLWFSVQAGNWPLADFYQNETASHIGWTDRVSPRASPKGELRRHPEADAEVRGGLRQARVRNEVAAIDLAVTSALERITTPTPCCMPVTTGATRSMSERQFRSVARTPSFSRLTPAATTRSATAEIRMKFSSFVIGGLGEPANSRSY
jgi:hypothetical protein